MTARLAALLLAVAPVLHAQVTDTIDVSRIIIDARIWSADGTAFELTPADLRVRVDGKPAEIVSIDYVSDVSHTEPATQPAEQPEEGIEVIPPPPPRGRTLIYFVQTDFGRAAQRVVGEMQLITNFNKFLETLAPADRVAILTFDSHLVLRLDFSSDREQIRKAFERVLRIEDVKPELTGASPSLAAMLDEKTMKETATSEEALTLIAHVLRDIDGPKTMILFGWGLSEPLGGKAWLSPRIPRISAELAAARVTVYSFNFGVGAQMRIGLESVAYDTGGFYTSTHGIAFDNGIKRLKVTLEGHYEIEVKNPLPSTPGKIHTLEVQGVRRGLHIEAKHTFVDR